jgi:hypothetical protein
VLTQNLSMLSPSEVFFGQSGPTSFADWQSYSSEEYVEFNIVASAFFVPRVLTMFHNRLPPVIDWGERNRRFLLLRLSAWKHC